MAKTSGKSIELVSAGDIAKLAGVSSNTVHHWRKRDPKFPKPVRRPMAGDLYSKSEVLTWLRKTKRI